MSSALPKDAVPSKASYTTRWDTTGRCPPEDVGGPRGYGEYPEALADPHHKRHAEMIEWRGPTFDPTKVDVTEIDFALKALAQKWSRTLKPKAI